jgi:hypothetical protein
MIFFLKSKSQVTHIKMISTQGQIMPRQLQIRYWWESKHKSIFKFQSSNQNAKPRAPPPPTTSKNTRDNYK